MEPLGPQAIGRESQLVQATQHSSHLQFIPFWEKHSALPVLGLMRAGRLALWALIRKQFQSEGVSGGGGGVRGGGVNKN